MSLWDLVRVINMLILIKLLRVITTQFKAMYIVTSTIYDLIRNLKAFAGLLAVSRWSLCYESPASSLKVSRRLVSCTCETV